MALPADQSGPVETMMAGDAASRMLGIELTEFGPGWARTRMTVRADMVNGHALCHGGMIFSLADTAFACACNSWGPVTVAAECDVLFVAPARLGDVLTAEARMRSRFGRAGIYDVTVSAGDTLIAEFRGRSAEVRPPRVLSRRTPTPGVKGEPFRAIRNICFHVTAQIAPFADNSNKRQGRWPLASPESR